MSLFTLHGGDCRKVLAGMAEASIDSIVTDPPYGLEFMGKEWDAPWKKTDEAGGKRTGFGVADGSKFRQNRGTPSFGVVGNPTCLNCGGDKYRNGPRKCACDAPRFPNQMATQMRAFQVWCEEWATECLRVLKPGGYLLAFSGTRTYHRMVCAIEDAGFEIRDQIGWAYGSGFPKSHNGEWGGTALKPAWEPIVMARKPLIGTVEANWMAYGTGALNIDGCRVQTNDDLNGGAYAETGGRSVSGSLHAGSGMNQPGKTVGREFEQPEGRWPANLVHDGSDEVLAAFPEEAGAAAPVTVRNGDKFRNAYGAFAGNVDEQGSTLHGDSGSAARFFYCAKASAEDRHEGLAVPPSQFTHGTTLRQVENITQAGERKGNHHPTVKPTDLMRWLVRLVTPKGGVVLDPFMGSGSTGKAAVLENFRFVGIDMTPEYVEIARARIDHAERQGFQQDLLA